MIGTKLAHYEIISHLGTGGMGEVYQAADTKLGRSVAIKLLPEAFTHDAERAARFEREARVLASLNHSNIAAIFGLEESGDRKFLVMELVDGETLAERIKRGPIPVEESLTIAKQICEALEAAHERGIIHRDLKPANVKITPDSKVKVLDFGLAKAFEVETSNANLTQSPTLSIAATNVGMIMGTAAYMSPEQAKGKAVDRRTDIFAFGAVLYEMLTGRQAFEGEDLGDILGAVLKSEPDWNRLPASVPGRIRELLRLCLQKDAKKRRQTATDVRIDIEQALAAPEPAALPAASRARERRGWIVSAVLLIGLVAAAVPAVRYIYEPVPPEMRLDIEMPPSSQPLEFALSPDGMRLAFVAYDNGGQRLWVRPLNAVAPQPLPGTDGADYPFWSPDSRSIGFSAGRKLKRIDVAGGPAQILADAPVFRGGTWNRDGIILFAPNLTSSLIHIASTGGSPEMVTHLEKGQASHRFPQFLPDGRHFLYYVQATPELAGTYLGSIDGNDPKRLVAADTTGTLVSPDWMLYLQQGALRAQRLDTSRGVLVGNPVIVADPVDYDTAFYGAFSVSAGGMVAYRSGVGSRTQLTWFDRNGKTTGTVGDPDENGFGFPELSPDERRVAVDRILPGSQDIWLIDLLRGGVTHFIFDATFINRRPLWSPDGTQIVFGSRRNSGVDNLYTKPSSGAGTEQLLLESSGLKVANSWSTDGRFLLYGEDNPKTARDLWALPMQGDRKPIAVVNSPFDERNGQFSPDGKWVAYQSNETGRIEIYVVPFPADAGKWQVSTNGGISPRWRHDGKELFFIAPDAKLMAVAASVSGASFDAAPPVALFQTRIAGGGLNYSNKPQYAVSADGRFLINVPAGEATAAPITLIMNWKPPAK
jgi:eukaryotic-like serine/threonine-protein kinase